MYGGPAGLAALNCLFPTARKLRFALIRSETERNFIYYCRNNEFILLFTINFLQRIDLQRTRALRLASHGEHDQMQVRVLSMVRTMLHTRGVGFEFISCTHTICLSSFASKLCVLIQDCSAAPHACMHASWALHTNPCTDDARRWIPPSTWTPNNMTLLEDFRGDAFDADRFEGWMKVAAGLCVLAL